MPTKFKYDLTRNPYRGVLREVAKSEGVSQSAITQAIKKGNLRIATIVESLCKKREKQMKRLYVGG